MSGKRDRSPRQSRLADGPAHRPKQRRPHLADEMEAMGNHVGAAEMRRHLFGHKGRAARAFLDVLSHRKGLR